LHVLLSTALKNRLHFVNENELESVVDFNSNDAFSQLSYNDIIKLIACLPDGYRIIFNLYVVEGYQHAEIADLLNIKEATSRSQLTKARAYLKSLMQQELKRLAKHI
jgi:RNA polymerase sigma factor (sigma-70 family)